MKTFLICVILPFALGGPSFLVDAHHEAVDYRLAPRMHSNRSSTYDTCTPNNNRVYCVDCHKRAMCVQGVPDPIEVILETCPSTKICINGACVAPPANPPCSPLEKIGFTCNTFGTFPDPGDCMKFHVCVSETPKDPSTLQHYEVDCEGPAGQYGYNVVKGVCDKVLTNKKCSTYPVPLCTGPYRSAVLTENPSHYFICTPIGDVLYPQQYRCDNGKRFNTATNACA